ncbi:hypothetical protein KI387_034813, partial [Taxus chinensis]
MQYPGAGGGYYQMDAHAHGQAEAQAPHLSYNWASAPPYGEVAAAHAQPAQYYPHGDVHVPAPDPPNYVYNPPPPAAANYPNSFSQYPSTTPSPSPSPSSSQFAPQSTPAASSNYGYTNPNPNPNPTAPFYHSPPLPNPNPNLSYPHPLPQPPESTGYSFPYSTGYEQGFYETPIANENSSFEVDDGGFGGEVYAYDGGRMEPYGARGTGTGSGSGSTGTGLGSTGFDDYGNLKKITKAVPKTETLDGGNGVQKFRVKILPDSASSSMDVLCQIGLDGLRMLDPSTSRTLRIYPLETITRWEVTDPSVYTFWAKSSVDIEPRRIRLQSNRYTTSTILDTVAAACVQIREMAEDKSNSYIDTNKSSEQPTEKKKGPIPEWMILRKTAEEKQHWVPDEAVTKCTACATDFGAFVRRHHCRNCGDIFCDKCTQGRAALTADKDAQPVRVCDRCLAEVTQRLSSTKEKSSKDTPQRTHDDLARRLLEEMGRKSEGEL